MLIRKYLMFRKKKAMIGWQIPHCVNTILTHLTYIAIGKKSSSVLNNSLGGNA